MDWVSLVPGFITLATPLLPGARKGIFQRALLASVFGLRPAKISRSGITCFISKAGRGFVSPALILEFQLIQAIARASVQAVCEEEWVLSVLEKLTTVRIAF